MKRGYALRPHVYGCSSLEHSDATFIVCVNCANQRSEASARVCAYRTERQRTRGDERVLAHISVEPGRGPACYHRRTQVFSGIGLGLLRVV